MEKNKLDYTGLENQIYKKSYKLSEVKDQIEKLGFDIVRFKDDDRKADLWQVQSADDGDYIVALYQPEEEIKTSSWEVLSNKIAGFLQISYKGDPLVRLSSSKLGIPVSELSQAEKYLPEKLASNKKLVKALLNEMPESTKKQVLSKYPELL